MHTIELAGPSLDAFRPAIAPDPEPGPGEVLIRLKAAALNFVDIAVATGGFPVPGFPIIPVADGAGEVVALGADVTSFKTGDRVIPHFMPRWQGGPISPANVAGMRGVSLPGSLSEYVTVAATSLVPMPEHLGFNEGATLPIAGTTAWNAVRSAQVKPGSTVVLLGAGGVSIWALQFAKAAGATVIVTSSTDERLQQARALGADHLVNYRVRPDWAAEVVSITDGRGADLVVETVGQATINQSLKAAAYGGTVFTVGFLTGATASIDFLSIIVKALKVVGNNTGSVSDFKDATRAVAAHGIVPVIGRSFGIDETRNAYAELAAGGRHFGKIAIVH